MHPKANINPELKLAGSTMVWGSRVDVYTKSGVLPEWAVDSDSEQLPVITRQPSESRSSPPKSKTRYTITDSGSAKAIIHMTNIADPDYISSSKKSFIDSMKVLMSIHGGSSLPSDIVKSCMMPEPKVMNIIRKLIDQGFIRGESP